MYISIKIDKNEKYACENIGIKFITHDTRN